MKLRGSYTVEAALIMAILIPVLISLLYMGEFLTDGVRMNAVMAEGSLRIRTDAGSGRTWIRDQGGFFFLHAASMAVSDGGKEITVSAREAPAAVGYGASFEAVYSCKVRDPAGWIRKIRGLQNLAEGGSTIGSGISKRSE